ncbi:MAG TPA: sigma-70 family RNA polymerase sigma factor, partial [Chthonomonadaceae bacterium]|nr:sigma-70 family RNA polymerase sigma factor [Chthonomonadaceae bacterium]
MGDEELVRTIRAGQMDRYTTLVGRYQERIYRLCYRICGNPVDAETLAHDSFVDAYLKLDQLKNPSLFGPWLRTIALNQCRGWYRQRRRLIELPCEEVAYVPESEAEPEEDYSALYAGLSHLSALHRMVLALHYWEGLSYEEVARFLDLPMGTVMSRLHRARHELKRRIQQEEREETMMMPPADDFAREVEAEIRVLLRLVPANREAQERLSVLFGRAPHHLIALMRDPEDPQVLADLALLLGRLGATGIETTLAAYFSAESDLRAHAATVLAQFAALNPAAKRGAMLTRITDRGIYLLVDRLIHFAEAEPAAKVELLLDLLAGATKQERTALLLTNTLLCWPEAALPALAARFWSAAKPEDLFRPADNLHALCRMGTRFAALLIPALQGEAEATREQRLAFYGAEALARTLHCDWFDLDVVADADVALDARFRRKWAVPLRQDRDPERMRRLAEAVASFSRKEGHSHTADTRERVIRTLGYLRAQEELPALLAAAQEAGAPNLRHTALRALGDLRDPRAADFLIKTMLSADPMERRLAVEALGNLEQPDYLPHVTERLSDP